MGRGGRGGLPAGDVEMAGEDLELPLPAQYSCDELLSAAPRAEDVEACLERARAQYVNKSQHFVRDGRGYSCQYAQIYFMRLTKHKKALQERVAQCWPGIPVVSILELKGSEDCCVIGTIFKDMKFKPSVMNEYSSDPIIAPALEGGKLMDASDISVMEDEGARMSLKAATPALEETLKNTITGVIAAVRGHDNEGVFEIQEILFPGMPPQPPLPTRDDDAYVALISGLGMGNTGAGDEDLRLQLAIDYLVGLLGSQQDQEDASKVVRVVVAGGLLASSEPLVGSVNTMSGARAKTISMEPIKDADLALTQLAAGVPVDVMPGASDPATASLPQQPMHRCLFPGAAAYPTVTRATNPHSFEVGGVSFLGGSGQTVDDAYRYIPCEDRLKIMSSTLEWCHLSPTSPDTLPTFPFSDRDPFILNESPHCFFMGNQPEFATRKAKGANGQEVRLVCVPRFSESGIVVLVNLRTLACRPVQFETPLLHT